jgi:ABC-type antimicrobial peptide transport system permease subunit
MDAVLSTVTAEPRLRSLTLVAFALMAVVIAGVGLHGVVAYSVSQRRAEMGVRMALGADGPRIRRMVQREGLALALAGAGIGLAGAAGATRLVHGLLYGITSNDPLSYGAAGLGVITVGLAATYLPARRAAHTDPATALRGE